MSWAALAANSSEDTHSVLSHWEVGVAGAVSWPAAPRVCYQVGLSALSPPTPGDGAPGHPGSPAPHPQPHRSHVEVPTLLVLGALSRTRAQAARSPAGPSSAISLWAPLLPKSSASPENGFLPQALSPPPRGPAEKQGPRHRARLPWQRAGEDLVRPREQERLRGWSPNPRQRRVHFLPVLRAAVIAPPLSLQLESFYKYIFIDF